MSNITTHLKTISTPEGKSAYTLNKVGETVSTSPIEVVDGQVTPILFTIENKSLTQGDSESALSGMRKQYVDALRAHTAQAESVAEDEVEVVETLCDTLMKDTGNGSDRGYYGKATVGYVAYSTKVEVVVTEAVMSPPIPTTP